MSKVNKRKKNYYVQFHKKQRNNTLTTGVRGFLLTCNTTQEKQCLREAYNLLNEYADKLYGVEKVEDEREKEGDIETSLENELKGLQETSKKPRRFQQVYTGVQSCLFVQTQLEESCTLVVNILQDLQKTRKQKTKYLLRMMPTLATCKPYEDNIKAGIVEAIELFLKNCPEFREKEKILYLIIFRARNNNSLHRDDVISWIISAIKEKFVGWEPEIPNPDLVISVDVLNVICCLSLMPGYFQYKKYNLLEVAKSEEAKKQGGSEAIENDGAKDTKSETQVTEDQERLKELINEHDNQASKSDSHMKEESKNLDTVLIISEEVHPSCEHVPLNEVPKDEDHENAGVI